MYEEMNLSQLNILIYTAVALIFWFLVKGSKGDHDPVFQTHFNQIYVSRKII